MPFTFTTNNRIASRWDGSNFQEEVLTLSGADGINVSVDSAQFTISGNSSAVSGYVDSRIATLSGYVNTQDAAAVTSGQSYTNSQISTLSGYVNTQDAAAVTSGQSYTNSQIASYSGYAEGAFVNVSGDTMTGFLTLNADPTASGHAATKQYVDAQVASAAINVQEDNVAVASSVGTLDFGHGLDVTSGTGEAVIVVDESEFTDVVMRSGTQTISGAKTFVNDVTVQGDLNVSGTINQINTEELLVEDNNIILNSTWSGAPTEDASILVERGNLNDAQILWNENDDRWELGISGALERILTQSDFDTLSGTVTSGYQAADLALSGALVSGYQAADVALSGALNTQITTLSGYVNTQDAAAVTSGQSYTNSQIAALSGYVDTQDAAAVTSGQSYTNGQIAALSGYVDTQDAAAVTSGQSYTNSQIASYSGYAEGAFVNVSGDTMTGFLTLNADPTASGHAATKQYVDAQIVASGGNYVHLTGNETISGTKTFASPIVLASGTEPTTISATGATGEVRWSDDYLYLCVATDSWKRVALAQF